MLQKQCSTLSVAVYVVRFSADGVAICSVPAYEVPQVPERRRQVLQRQRETGMGSSAVSKVRVAWKEVQAQATAMVVVGGEAIVDCKIRRVIRIVLVGP